MNENKSVDELLKALERARANVPKDWDSLSNDEEVMFQVFEMEYNVKPLSQHIGVDKELLPDPAQLEDDEIQVIVEKILDVWAAYHYLADLPKGLPIRIAYDVLCSVWDEEVTSCPFGNFHFDFYDMDLRQFVKKNQAKK